MPLLLPIDSFNGFGLGLRPAHYQTIVESNPAIDFFEIMTEDYLVPGGSRHYYLALIRERYPLVMHGVSLSIGSVDPLNISYLNKLRALIHDVEPLWVSDHLCWTGVGQINTHDLLPLPYTAESLQHVVARIKQVQDFLGRQVLLENISSYLEFNCSQMLEWDFLTAVAAQSGCGILLDINNIYVNSFNHKFDATQYINAIPVDLVKQFHIAGHANRQTHIIDTHDSDIIPEVWDLYKKAKDRFPQAATLIERDGAIPPLQDLLTELQVAKCMVSSREVI